MIETSGEVSLQLRFCVFATSRKNTRIHSCSKITDDEDPAAETPMESGKESLLSGYKDFEPLGRLRRSRWSGEQHVQEHRKEQPCLKISI